ncbi:tRNA 2'-O-methylase [bacterium BMS3Bbin14]|nr:tRNA 2'-O-methylase [bacterium BMS3Abin13]GBE51646.1 tRNA 2'-O-methylase [bacterium BMS3Bbin14]
MERIPDIDECFRLMEQYEMLPNIRRHSIVVARVTWRLIDSLQRSDLLSAPVPDQGLSVAGALLHDIAKTTCLAAGCDHAEVGAEICRRHGYPGIARIVAEHVILRGHDPQRYRRGAFTAREIVYYADKRVRHEEIVSLDERLDYILEHYGRNDLLLHELIRKNFARCVELEHHMFSFLPFAPGQLADTVSGDPVAAAGCLPPGPETGGAWLIRG